MFNSITTLYLPIYQYDNLISFSLLLLIVVAFKCKLDVLPIWYPITALTAIAGLVFSVSSSSPLSIPWMLLAGALAYHAGSKLHFGDNGNDDDWRGGDEDPDGPRFPWGEFDSTRKQWEDSQVKV